MYYTGSTAESALQMATKTTQTVKAGSNDKQELFFCASVPMFARYSPAVMRVIEQQRQCPGRDQRTSDPSYVAGVALRPRAAPVAAAAWTTRAAVAHADYPRRL